MRTRQSIGSCHDIKASKKHLAGHDVDDKTIRKAASSFCDSELHAQQEVANERETQSSSRKKHIKCVAQTVKKVVTQTTPTHAMKLSTHS